MPIASRSRVSARPKNAGKRVSIETITFKKVSEPRLRFDRTATGLIKRLQTTLAKSVPEGKTVVVTVTAPIRQDSKTGLALANKINKLLSTGRARLRSIICGNGIEVHVLKGGGARTPRLIGFVHNPAPNPAALFHVTRSLLACIGSRKRRPAVDRWLIVEDPDGHAPIETVRQVCSALRARSVFKRILLTERGGVSAL